MNVATVNTVPKKRKLVDKNVPGAVLADPAFAVDSKMYQDLMDMEKKLDWTMLRKKAEVQDAMGRVVSTTRTLRLFISHTVSEQAWQTSGTEEPNFETGKGVPAWQLKIEGRLLELPNARAKDKTTPRPLSTFIKAMIIEMDRDPAAYPDGNIVEWHRGANQPTLDGFTVRRLGDQPTKIRVLLHLEHYPEHFKVNQELANLIGVKEESRVGIIQAVWNYVKVQGLLDKVDRRRIHLDAPLRHLVAQATGQPPPETLLFSSLPELVNRCIVPSDPVIIHYVLDPTVPPLEKPLAWDIEVRVEDAGLKAKMSGLTVNASRETTQELIKLDDEIATLVQSMHASVLKRQFLSAFAENPTQFIQKFLESQSHDLESILGSGPTEGGTLRKEDLQRSEFFRMPWVEEAVAIWDGLRLANPRVQ